MQALEALRAEMPDLTGGAGVGLPPHVAHDQFAAELFLRLTYSRLSTPTASTPRRTRWAEAPPERGGSATLDELWARYEAFLERQQSVPNTTVNRVRREVHEACLDAATEQPGLFRLTVPPAAARTPLRDGLRAAPRHRARHATVVVAVPFTTITQQTADVYRRIFGDGYPDGGPRRARASLGRRRERPCRGR